MHNLKDEQNILDEGFIQCEDNNDNNNSVENINKNFNIASELREDSIDHDIPMEDYTEIVNIKNEYLINLGRKEFEAHRREKVLFNQKTFAEIKYNISKLYTHALKDKNKRGKNKKRKKCLV